MRRKVAILALVLSACSAPRESAKVDVPVPAQATPLPVVSAPAVTPNPPPPPAKDPNEESLLELKFKQPTALTVVEVTRDPATLPAPIPRHAPVASVPGRAASGVPAKVGEPTPDITPKQLAALATALPADTGRLVKLDDRGRVLPLAAKDWACVRDTKTGLVWESKTTAGERNRDFTYSVTGTAGECGQKACGVDGYVQLLNKAALCGIKKWRLPKRHELVGVVNATLADPYPKVDVRYFSNVRRGYYWSATEFQFNPQRMWTVNFSTGQDNSHDKSEPAYLMLVAEQ
ncbi:MAG: DUF1566 domain-containing protein [Pseudomonadota bacterium]